MDDHGACGYGSNLVVPYPVIPRYRLGVPTPNIEAAFGL